MLPNETPERQLIKKILAMPPDIHLLSSNGEKVPAHKLILAACSPVFNRMFNDGAENKMGEIQIATNHSTGALVAAVQLIYSQPCLALKEHVLELMEIFDFYQLGSLTVLTGEARLERIITKDNVADIFFAAAKFKQIETLTMAKKMIEENKVDIFASESWKTGKRKGMTLDEKGIEVIFEVSKK